MVSEFFTPEGPTVNPEKQNYWPFPACPPTAWTLEQIEEYNRQQRQQVPDAPM